MRKEHLNKTLEMVKKILEMANKERKLSGFSIGNTAKIDENSLYFTPIRMTSLMVFGGVIVYSEGQAIDISRTVDGKVQYVLVDAEKKIPDEMSMTGEPANVERSVRESVRKSTLWVYKGNDISVEAVDGLLAQLTKNEIRGIGGKKVAIIGAGNLGSKLALKLVERGAQVFITRRDLKKLKVIAEALNYVKPRYTKAMITAVTDNCKASKGADILIGATQGMPVITAGMVRSLSPRAIIVDVGKGSLYPEAIKTAHRLNINVFRLDVAAAFEGLISKLWAMENIVENKMGRKLFHKIPVVSGGLLGRRGEVVVDNVNNPAFIYGIANGRGDFIRKPSKKQAEMLRRLKGGI